MKSIFLGLLILIGLHLVILLNFQFTAWPEMFSYPYLINHGFKLYQDIAMPYQPLLPVILSGIYSLVDYKEEVLKALTWLLLLLSDCLIFTISLKLIGRKFISLLPLLFFVLIQPLAGGNMLWFDLATAPFILLGLTTFIFLKDKIRFFWLGLFLGLAFFIKQQTGVAIALLGLYLIFIQRPRINAVYFIGGLVVPTILVLFFVLINGIWNDYIFWTTIVPLFWYPKFPGYVHMPSVSDLVKMILILAPGITYVIFSYSKFKSNNYFLILLLLFIGTFITAFPRFEFFRLQPAIAVFAVLLVFILVSKKNILSVFIPLLLATFLLVKHDLIFYHQPTRFFGPDDIRLASKVSETANNEKIYILGSSSLTYVLSNKVPPKPWLDNYIWYMEIPGMQQKVVDSLNNEVEFIFWRKPDLGLWYANGTYQPQHIVEYINNNYMKVDELNQEVDIWQRK